MDNRPLKINDADLNSDIWNRHGHIKVDFDMIMKEPTLIRGILSDMVIIRTVQDNTTISYYGNSAYFDKIIPAPRDMHDVPEYVADIKTEENVYKYIYKKVLPTVGETPTIN